MNEIKQQKIKLNENEKKIVQIIKIKMTSLIIYWVLLTKFINFLSINFCRVNNQMNQIYQNGKSKETKIRREKKES